MKQILFCLFVFLFLLCHASQLNANSDAEGIVHDKRIQENLSDFWKLLRKYYRFTKRKFNCLLWGINCPPPVAPNEPQITSDSSKMDEAEDWLPSFDKSIHNVPKAAKL